MLRTIAAVIAGYIAMFIVVAVGLTAAFMALGPDWAYQEATYDITVRWGVLMLAVGLVAAILGGVTCGFVSKHAKIAKHALIAAVLVLGALNAVFVLTQDPPKPEDNIRLPEDSVFENAGKARQPAWTLIANPLIGAVGVCLGGTLVRSRGASRTTP